MREVIDDLNGLTVDNGSTFGRIYPDLNLSGMLSRVQNLNQPHLKLQSTMQSFPRSLFCSARRNVAWACSSCARANRQSPISLFFKPSMRARMISNQTKPKPNVAPTMQQLRKPFQQKNRTTMYYTLSIILGTVALSYGSVPMYKMVR